MGKLTGKTALITGAARGLGRAYALRLAKLGADVGVIDVNLHSYQDFKEEAITEGADTVLDELRALGVKAAGAEANVADRDEIFTAIKNLADELGDFDIVICNAGGGSGAMTANTASNMDLDQFDLVLDRNLKGTVYTCTAVVPMMKKKGAGKIINVTSHVGMIATCTGSYCHYGVAKAAIIHYTRYLAQELGPFNITANCIAPGFISTGRMATGFAAVGNEKFIEPLALKRFGTVEDCANGIEFLATDLSDYVTGDVLDLTGGTVNRLQLNL